MNTRVTAAVITARIFGARYQFQVQVSKITRKAVSGNFHRGLCFNFFMNIFRSPSSLSLAVYISNQKISLQSTNCVVQLDRKLTWRRWCLWTGVDLSVDLTYPSMLMCLLFVSWGAPSFQPESSGTNSFLLPQTVNPMKNLNKSKIEIQLKRVGRWATNHQKIFSET